MAADLKGQARAGLSQLEKQRVGSAQPGRSAEGTRCRGFTSLCRDARGKDSRCPCGRGRLPARSLGDTPGGKTCAFGGNGAECPLFCAESFLNFCSGACHTPSLSPRVRHRLTAGTGKEASPAFPNEELSFCRLYL